MIPVRRHIVYSVLNWGLGHATRSIPIIECLVGLGYRVTCCSSKDALSILKKALPHLDHVELPDYEVQYRWNNMAMNMAMQAPKMFRAISDEQKIIESIHDKDPVDLCISDQRYGCYIKGLPSVFLTHQVSLKARKALTTTMANKLHYLWMSRFDEIWVPDHVDYPGLSGKLSHADIDIPVYYVGPLSRFTEQSEVPSNFDYDWLFLLSGPEPARSQLEELLIQLMEASSQQAVLVRGKVDDDSDVQHSSQLRVIGHLQAEDLRLLIASSQGVICRSGYSTLMDLAVLGKKALLIPTPGQPEQIYLANLWKQQYSWPVKLQSELTAIPTTDILKGADPLPSSGKNEGMLNTLTSRLHQIIH